MIPSMGNLEKRVVVGMVLYGFGQAAPKAPFGCVNPRHMPING